MTKKKDNLVQFDPTNCSWVTPKKVFINSGGCLIKNANVVDIKTGTRTSYDILVEDGIIKKMSKFSIEPETQMPVFDLCFDCVLPAFVNAFKDSTKIMNLIHKEFDQITLNYLTELLEYKTLLSGAYSASNENTIILENVADLSEKELSEISDKAAKNNSTIFLKVGQTLDELGRVDKKYGKSLPLVLEEFGILDRKWVLIGGNCLEKDDLQIFREHGQDVIVLPNEDAQCGRRPTNLLTLRNLDFNIKIGSGRAFEIDFFGYLRQILAAHWGTFEDTKCLSEKDVLLMATGGVSTLKEGEQANFFALCFKQPHYEDLLKSIVWGRSKTDVQLTVHRGKTMQRGGHVYIGKGYGIEYIMDELALCLMKDKPNKKEKGRR